MSFDFVKAAQTIGILRSVYASVGPMIHDVVVQMEAIIPAGSNGAAKLAEAQKILGSIATAAGIAEADFVIAWPIISAVISSIVSLYNLGNGWSAAIAGVTSVVNVLATPAPASN